VPVALSGLASGILVVAANAWMQAPGGATIIDGVLIDADPLAPFRSPAWLHMSIHSSLSCYIATGMAVAGVYATGLLRGRGDDYHRSGLGIAMAVVAVTALLQPLSGDLSARRVAAYQPAKLAAMEAHYETGTRVPLLIGGIPDDDARTVRWGIEIPSGLSLLIGHDPDTEVIGLDAFAASDRPNTLITHIAFQVMVGCGFTLIGIALWWLWRRRRGTEGPWLLRAILVASPLGFLALEAGWIVTEVGRQPWVIYDIMRTKDGVTPVAEVPLTLLGFSLLYAALGVALVFLLRGLVTHGTTVSREDAHVA
jgi:cytochrome d ubiquinol oxidase subunit I